MKRRPIPTIIMYAVLILVMLIWLFPIYTAISKSFDIKGWGNYWFVITTPQVHYGRVVLNSLMISLATAVIVVLLTSLAGYAFAKMHFRGSKVFYVLLLSCMAVPIASVTMPLFFTIKTFHLINTYMGLVLPMVAFNALQMLLLWRNYFEGIPDEILEAARVDGCGSFKIYASILLPLSAPMIATTGVLTFVYSWNEYLIPLLIMRDPLKYPVTLASTYFMEGKMQTPEMAAQMYAALILMTVPSVIVYLISQHWLQAGVTAGSVKS